MCLVPVRFRGFFAGPVQKRAILNIYNFGVGPSLIMPVESLRGFPMMHHKGVEYTIALSSTPGVWKWQFRIGDLVKSGRTETRINLMAVRRVQLRIDRELKKTGRAATA
jgi:hypothetical protein